MKDDKRNREIEDYISASMFVEVELKDYLPIELLHEKDAWKILYDLSNGLISEDNSIIIIEDNRIEFVKIVSKIPNIQKGDIVKAAPVISNNYDADLDGFFSWACDYPEGYHIVLTNPSIKGEINLQSLVNGNRIIRPVTGWQKVGIVKGQIIGFGITEEGD
tara:strand:+ start:772 stop:1257 length:486 start_codon:yes stop_codon:yes gene_type:complete